MSITVCTNDVVLRKTRRSYALGRESEGIRNYDEEHVACITTYVSEIITTNIPKWGGYE
jgi:hypothetical protein